MLVFSFIAPSPVQVCVVLILGVLFFGKNLPDVAKRVGQSLMEFKKGLNEMSEVTKEVASTDTIENSHRSDTQSSMETDKYEVIGTKFEPPLQ